MNMIVIFIVSDFFYQVDAVTCRKKKHTNRRTSR